MRFRHLGYEVESLIEHEYIHCLATVRLRPPVPGGVLVDLLFASSGIDPEIIQEAERVELVPGWALPVARAAHLVTLKLLARDDTTRPQDSADLVALRQVLTEDDKADLRRLVRVVVERGYHRHRDLIVLAESYIAGS